MKNRQKKMKSGFTLIELLIVVAIIAILAAIAVPNFAESQNRAKMTRSKSDMRAVAVALETFHVDNNKYPRCSPDLNGDLSLFQITTPIAYVNREAVIDIYSGRDALGGIRNQFGYMARDHEGLADFTNNQSQPRWWILSSNGPDIFFDNYYNAIETDSYDGFIDTIYDPTNGTASSGNIYRSGGLISGPGAEGARRVMNSDVNSVN